MKPHIPELTVCVVDCTNRVRLAIRAIERTLEQISPYTVKLLTHHDSPDNGIGVITIPKINSLEEYSRFMIRELWKYVDTSHALVIQSDGYVLNGSAWNPEWLQYDYIGAPFNPSGIVGNGGLSLRSAKLLKACARFPKYNEHPEDAQISFNCRDQLTLAGCKFAPTEVAQQFSFEGRSWNAKEWEGVETKWEGQFGFHSLLTVLPPDKKPCNVFHHSGDAGDVIYGLATMKALGGGALFLSPHNNYPYPKPSRWAREGGEPSFVENLYPLLIAQDYVDRCSYTHGTPFSTTWDLNKFREPWKKPSSLDTESIWRLHQIAFGIKLGYKPWLTVPFPVSIPDKPIVVNRTGRYHNDSFPWYDLVQRYSEKMIFVGSEQEAKIFEGFAVPKKPVKWYPTKDALELAKVISGGRIFIGNQSLALSISLGVGQKSVCEEWPQNRNCKIPNTDCLYCFHGSDMASIQSKIDSVL